MFDVDIRQMNGNFNLQQSDYSANKGMNGNFNDDKASMLFLL